MNTSTITLDGQKIVSLVDIEARDVPLCRIGLALMEAQLKAARKVLTAIGLDPGYVAEREAQTDWLKDCFKDERSAGVPLLMLRTLRAALAIEMDRVAKVQAAQMELLINDAEASTRLKQLDRLLSDLDVAQMREAAA